MSRYTLEISRDNYISLIETAQDSTKVKSLNQQERKVLKEAVHSFKKDRETCRIKRIDNQITYESIIEKLNGNGVSEEPSKWSFFKKIGNCFHLRIGIASLHKTLASAPRLHRDFDIFYNELSNEERNSKVRNFQRLHEIVTDRNMTDKQKMDAFYDNADLRAFIHIESYRIAFFFNKKHARTTIARVNEGIAYIAMLSKEHGAKETAREIAKTPMPCMDGTLRGLQEKYPHAVMKSSIFMPNMDPTHNENQRISELYNAYVNIEVEKILMKEKQPHENDDISNYRRNNDININIDDFITWCTNNDYIGRLSTTYKKKWGNLKYDEDVRFCEISIRAPLNEFMSYL